MLEPDKTFQLSGSFDLSGRVALVTGGAGLLGAEFSRTLAQAGATVVIADIDGDSASQLSMNLDKQTLKSFPVEVDITEPEAVHEMIQRTLRLFGRLDILVNNAALDPKFDPQHATPEAALTTYGDFENFSLEDWNRALAVNLTGAFLCCQAAVQPMLNQGGGVIINISSIYGLVGPDQRLYSQPGEVKKYKPVYYSVTKAAILGLTRYLATYYAGKNIRVNALTPGGVYNGHDPDFVMTYSARTVLGRMAEKDELNGALLFLASDASKYMTGANLVIDGGWTAW